MRSVLRQPTAPPRVSGTSEIIAKRVHQLVTEQRDRLLAGITHTDDDERDQAIRSIEAHNRRAMLDAMGAGGAAKGFLRITRGPVPVADRQGRIKLEGPTADLIVTARALDQAKVELEQAAQQRQTKVKMA